MSDILKKHIEKFIAVHKQEYANILSYFQPLKVAKKQNLLVEGKVVASATGHNDNHMRPECFDVTAWTGQTAQLQIVDEARGSWGNIGVDQIVVDEAQEFRKLSFATNMSTLKGIDPNGSQRAWDLFVKSRYIETKNPGRALVLASGTPITNTLGEMFSVQRLLGYAMAPVCWLLGIPWKQAVTAGALMGIKTMLNEFIAYVELSRLPADALDPRSRLIMLYAMCGFANFGSLGIMIAGLGTMAPERRDEVVSLGLKSIVSGTLATCLVGATVGVLRAQ